MIKFIGEVLPKGAENGFQNDIGALSKLLGPLFLDTLGENALDEALVFVKESFLDKALFFTN